MGLGPIDLKEAARIIYERMSPWPRVGSHGCRMRRSVAATVDVHGEADANAALTGRREPSSLDAPRCLRENAFCADLRPVANRCAQKAEGCDAHLCAAAAVLPFNPGGQVWTIGVD